MHRHTAWPTCLADRDRDCDRSGELSITARRVADLVDRMPGLIEACAVPDLDVLGIYEPAWLSYCPRQLAWAVLVSSGESCR
jgi:hypothetical protein